MVKLYQNLSTRNEKFNAQNPTRKNSKYWNEGKFETFIKPHIKESNLCDMTFFEFGTNAGLFLKMAIDLGFRNSVGFEKCSGTVQEGIRYRDALNYDYKIYNHTLDDNFDIGKIPICDYLLLSTFHYYVDINTWIKFINQLRLKARYIIIVSRDTKNHHWLAKSDLGSIKRYFKDWEEVSYIPTTIFKNDPHPRKDMWSICFKNNNLDRISLDGISLGNSKIEKEKYQLAKEICSNETVDYINTDYYKKWQQRKPNWNKDKLNKFVEEKYKLMLSVKTNGLFCPIIIQEDNNLLSDGGHRLSVIKTLNYKTVIVYKI